MMIWGWKKAWLRDYMIMQNRQGGNCLVASFMTEQDRPITEEQRRSIRRIFGPYGAVMSDEDVDAVMKAPLSITELDASRRLKPGELDNSWAR